MRLPRTDHAGPDHAGPGRAVPSSPGPEPSGPASGSGNAAWSDDLLAGVVPVGSEAELRELLGEPVPAAANKVRSALTDDHRAWLARSPFCLIATAGEDGRCDVSPKGDPQGFTLVLDGTHLAIPDRPGNRRADGFRNVLTNPHVGLIYLVPGRGDTLRVNGRAQLVRDAPFFDRMVVKGHRPALALVVTVEEVFFHCPKAFMRSALWRPETWDPQALPSRAQIVQRLERPDDSLEQLEEYYGESYAERLYAAADAPPRPSVR